MKVLILLLLVLAQTGFSQTHVEERALIYFLENIYPKEYPELPKLRFSKMTEDGYTLFGVTDNCFDNFDYQFKVELDKIANNNSKDYSKYQIKLKSHRYYLGLWAKHQLRVFKATRLRDFQYVLISVYKDKHEDLFITEINSNNIVTQFCKNTLVY
jgi:hypothetical protein